MFEQIKSKLYFIDIESTGLSKTSRLHVLSYGVYENGELVIKSTRDFKEIRDIFENSENIVVGHNFYSFDLHVLKHNIQGLEKKCTIWDSLYMSQYARPDRILHGLESWGEDIGVPKVEIKQEEWQGLQDEQFEALSTYKKYIEEGGILEGAHLDYYNELNEFQTAHYERMRIRCEVDVKITAHVYESLIKSLLKLYDDQEALVVKVIQGLSFKGTLLHCQQENRVPIDVEYTEKAYDILNQEFEAKKAELETIMDPTPTYAKKSLPKNMYKKDGSLSSHASKWYEFLKEQGVPLDNELPVKYVSKYVPPKGSSDDQQKELLFKYGWVPANFKKGANGDVPQLRVDGDNGKELCPSVLLVIERNPNVPQLQAIDGMSVLKHRLGILKGLLNREENLDKNNTVSAEFAGVAKTLRVRHVAPIVNLPRNNAKYGEYIRKCFIAPEGMVWVNADLSSLEDKTKQCCIIDLDPDYVSLLNVKGYDAHLTIGELAGFFDKEDVAFFKWFKQKPENRKHDDCPEKYKDKVEQFADIYEELSKTRSKAKTVNYSCFSKDNLVDTPNGPKSISDINIGDFVYGDWDKKLVKVLDKVPEYEDFLYRLKIKANYDNGIPNRYIQGIESTLTHRWLLSSGEYKTLEELEYGEELDLGLNRTGIYQGKKHMQKEEETVSCLVTETGNFYVYSRFGSSEESILTGNCTYGAGAKKVALTAACSLEEAEKLVQTYWKLNWSVKDFANNCITKKVRGMDWIWSRFSKRWLKYDSDHMKFSAVNQNFGATIFDVWVYYLMQAGVKPVMSMHDEVSFFIPDTPEYKKWAEQVVEWAIGKVNEVFKQPITFEAEPEFAYSYGDVH